MSDAPTCKKCGTTLERRAGQFFWRGRFFHGLVCVPCNALWDDPTDSFEEHVKQSAKDTFEPLKDCPECDVEDSVTWNREEEKFPYGIEPNTVELNCIVDKGSCAVCKFEFTDWRAEEARDAAVRAYLEGARP